MIKKGAIILGLMTVIELILVLAIFGVPESSPRTTKMGFFYYVDSGYVRYMMSVEEAIKYDTGDVFRIANYKDTDAKLTYQDGSPLKIRDLYVIHNSTFSDKELISYEKIDSDAIEGGLSGNLIMQIIRREDAVQFCGDERLGPADVKFWGFYYSLDGNPQIVEYNGDEILAEDGEGWSYWKDESNHYYTEKIKDKFYYYEGA